jgi:pseudouridine-5'-phosphate glycosidase
MFAAGVPVPAEHAESAAKVESAIQQALEEAARGGVRGAAVTPFLLKRIQELTGGASLDINIRLIKNNAAIGAQIAAALSKEAR